MHPEPAADPLQAALERTTAAFARRGVRYALIGGLATGYRSRPRYTKDVDVIVDVPAVELPGLLAELRAEGFEFEERDVIEEFTRHHMAVLWRSGVRCDWLRPVLPAYRHVLDTATLESADAAPLRVATAEGLVLLKLLAFRLQDQTDVEALVAANPALDLDWIRGEWAAIFPLDDPRLAWLEEQVRSVTGPRP
jgi:hypothetical protein